LELFSHKIDNRIKKLETSLPKADLRLHTNCTLYSYSFEDKQFKTIAVSLNFWGYYNKNFLIMKYPVFSKNTYKNSCSDSICYPNV